MYKDITDHDAATYAIEGASVAVRASGDTKTEARTTTGVNDNGCGNDTPYGLTEGQTPPQWEWCLD